MRTINEAVILSIKRLKQKGLKVIDIANRHELSVKQIKSILKGNFSIQGDQHMLFHECPECNCRCNCTDGKHSCCQEARKEAGE